MIRRKASTSKVVFVNRYFFPDESATSQMLTDLAHRLVQDDVRVSVICSRQLYDNSGARLSKRAEVDGIHIYRVWTSRFGRTNLVGRAVDYASFYVSAALRLWAIARAGDVIVAKTDPPMISIVAAFVSRLRGAHLINWLQDVFPEVASALGQNPLPGSLDRTLRKLRNWSLSKAVCNVVLGERMREHLLAQGIADERIATIENWADGGAIAPKPSESTELRRRENLRGKFIAGYSGNLGRAHEFQTLLDAARLLRDADDIVFLMIGDGAGMQRLRAAAEADRLTNIRFLPYQPRSELADSLCAADVHVVSLLPSLEGFIVPSKLYGILAAGRPVFFIGDPDGEVARAIRVGDCGTTISCGDGESLAQALQRYKSEPAIMFAQGLRSRAFFERCYTLEAATQKWLNMLQSLERPMTSDALGKIAL